MLKRSNEIKEDLITKYLNATIGEMSYILTKDINIVISFPSTGCLLNRYNSYNA